MKRRSQDPAVTARFQAWLVDSPNRRDPTLSEIDPFIDYLARITVTIRLMDGQERGASLDELCMAGHLFVIGASRLGVLEEYAARSVADSLILGELPKSAYVHQILTYILRYSKEKVGINLMLMMPLFALTELKWCHLYPNRSSLLISCIQSFCLCSDKYTRKSLMMFDPLDLLRKLQIVVRAISADQSKEGSEYLEIMLDSFRYVSSAYLAAMARRLTADTRVREQADNMLSSILTIHRTVVNTHLAKHRR